MRPGRASSRLAAALSLQHIHGAIDSHIKQPSASDRTKADPEVSFDDALHRLVNATPRPKTEEDLSNLCQLINTLINLCEKGEERSGASRSRWTDFVLALVHRRYHFRAPEAQAQKGLAGSKRKTTDSGSQGANESPAVTAGDGERLFFYVAVTCLLKYSSLLIEQSRVGNTEGDSLVDCAVECLFHIAPHAGGSRDVCALIEFGVHTILSDLISQRKEKFSLCASLPSSELIGRAVCVAETSLKDKKSGFEPVEELLRLAAQTIDSDLDTISQEGNAENESDDKLTSTLNVFIPHHDRGRLSGKKRQAVGDDSGKRKMSDRNMVQCVSELLIWSRTRSVSSDGSFASSYDGLSRLCSPQEADQTTLPEPEERENRKSAIKSCVQKMQTTVRRQRKILNSHARGQGFMLSDQFCIDPRAVTLGMVKRGKAGDLTRLMALAGKSGQARVLDMINIRNASDPSRVVPMDSVSRMKMGWVPLLGEEEDELKSTKLKLQEAMVRSTLKQLQQRCSSPKGPAPCVIASLDNSSANHAAAVLIGASMCSWVNEKEDPGKEIDNKTNEGMQCDKPVKGQEEKQCKGPAKGQKVFVQDRFLDVSSFEECMKHLDNLFVTSREAGSSEETAADGTATTKAVLNLIDRHVSDGNTLILLTSADLQLPDHSLDELQKRGCSIHCHTADDLSSRLKREGAQTGDVTVSLMWDTGDDLDLHVVMPSEEEIAYNNKTSKCGLGCLDVDMNAGGAESTEPVENVFLGQPDKRIEAPKGKYRVFVRNYAYHSSKRGEAVKWRVAVRMNGRVLEYAGACKGTAKASDETACEFEYSGRTIPFEKELENLSAFGTSNLVNITASTGQTLESLCQLMQAAHEHKELDRVRELVQEEDMEEAEEAKEQDADDGMVEDDVVEESANAVEEKSNDATESCVPKPLVAAPGKLEVTSRDRLYMLLCKLPPRFHEEAKRVFGGDTLMERCAEDVARRMLQDNISMGDLRRSGYPIELAEMVSSKMKKGAVPLAS